MIKKIEERKDPENAKAVKVRHTETDSADQETVSMWEEEPVEQAVPEFDFEYWMVQNYEKLYRQFCAEHRRQLQIFCEKHYSYGLDNIAGGEGVDMEDLDNVKDALRALRVRMQDKMSRFRMLIERLAEGPEIDAAVGDETIQDTLRDLSNYANIALIVSRGGWKKD
jgi:hypothetical protein